MAEQATLKCATVFLVTLLTMVNITEMDVVKAPPHLIPKGKGDTSMVGKVQ
jgi:hypothetical protein